MFQPVFRQPVFQQPVFRQPVLPRHLFPRPGFDRAALVRRVILGTVLGSVAACSAGAGTGGEQGYPTSPGAPSAEEFPAEPPPGEEAPSRSVEVGGVVQGGRASTFELTARAGEPAQVLRVTVGEVENPQDQALVLVIAALLPARQIELGRLSFYPPNQAGTFVLPLPAPVVEHVAQNRALTLRCALEAGAGAKLDAARVRLRALALGAEP
jgi:hypothetical protein